MASGPVCREKADFTMSFVLRCITLSGYGQHHIRGKAKLYHLAFIRKDFKKIGFQGALLTLDLKVNVVLKQERLLSF